MNNIFETVEGTLKNNPKYISEDGKLLKAIVYSDVMSMDNELLSLLLSSDDIKEAFFKKIDDTLVFDKQKFAWFIESKEFLPDSYTKYKNKIGLTHNGEFISKSNDVVLDFPFKDCVLEGGQTKEDQKRKEIFYNETIASDEISNMLAPKVFTNAKRYTSEGVEENITFDENDNLIIKGNNLIALSSLLNKYEGKIKFIYIDPPYNTGNDSFGYNDNFNHSTWLVFIKNRLLLAKRLLSPNGIICVQCDDNEQAYLKVLMDELFPNGFLNNIAVKMSEASGVKMNHAKERFPKLKEYILIYKMPNFNGFIDIDKYRVNEWDNENNLFIDFFSKEDRDKLIELESKEKNDNSDAMLANNILAKAKIIPLSEKIKDYTFKTENEKQDWLFNNCYRIIKTAGSTSLANLVKSFDNIPKQDIATAVSKNGVLFFYITSFNREAKQPRLQVIFADANIYKNPCDFWQDIKTTGAISDEGGVKLVNGKKPEKILFRLIKMMTSNQDTVLDFFTGSGTTAAVAHKMNRKYICVEQLNKHIELEIERLNNVIYGDSTGISKDVDWKGGGSFVYCELLENAQILINAVLAANDDNISEVKEGIYTDERIVPYITREELQKADSEFEDLSLEEKKQALIAIIDKNKLYVNYSDIDDETMQVSDSDKAFTKSFYEEV